LISRSIDEDVRLAGWLRRWIERDAELRQFEWQSRQLAGRLTREAAGWMASSQRHEKHQPVELRRLARSHASPSRRLTAMSWSLAACALAATAVIVWARFHTDSSRVAQPAWPADHRQADAPPVSTSLTNERQMLANAWKVGRAAAGQWQASRVLSTLDDGLQRQRQELSSGTRSAVSFFAYRLPVSAARLVGLRREQT
jgi:hypothetical protein